MKIFGRCLAALLFAACNHALSYGAPPEVVPLLHAHAHNDYEHARPLLDALDQGFTSVEADVFPVAGELLVGHERRLLKHDRTLDSLYLAPLAERVHINRDHVYPQPSRFFLLIDIKADPQETFRILQPLLAKYAAMLTVVENGQVRPSAVTVILTGNRPTLDPADKSIRYVGLDGRVADLDSKLPSHLMPMISDSWSSQFHWNGIGPMPESERDKLKNLVAKAHAHGRIVRFWATPENENLWRELLAAGVDLLNTDQLERLATFLNSSEAPKQP